MLQAVALLDSLLTISPEKRITIADALETAWVRGAKLVHVPEYLLRQPTEGPRYRGA